MHPVARGGFAFDPIAGPVHCAPLHPLHAPYDLGCPRDVAPTLEE